MALCTEGCGYGQLGHVAAAAEECASNDLSAVQNEIDELQAILDDSSDQVGLSVVICLLVLSHP